MHIERTPEPSAEWDAFVEATPGARLGHAAAWARVMDRAYGLETAYLTARGGGGEVVGVLPLVCFRTIRGQRELVSLPFLDAAGILAATGEGRAALRAAALDLAREVRASAVELRQAGPLPELPTPPPQDRVDLALELQPDEEGQWKALRAKVRNQTRKAEREGLRIAPGTPAELLPDFYRVFAENMRDLGSPVHARAFFAATAEAFGGRLRLVVTRLGDRAVGGLVAIEHAGVVTVPWASTLRSERSRCPNNAIYWEALRWAIGRNAATFDFGRSPRDGGTYRFKKGWGAEERELAWTRLGTDGDLLGADAAPGAALRGLSALWARLPVSVAGVAGPRIRRFLAN